MRGERSKGQASIEALLLLAAVLIVVSSLQFMGRSSSETTNVLFAARAGAEGAINRLAVENGIDLTISSLVMVNDNIVIHLIVQDPPPENQLGNRAIKSAIKYAAHEQVLEAVSKDYDIVVEIERVER